MKSSLRKLRELATIHTRHDHKERSDHDHLPPAHLDELAQASQDMLDMRNCYDSLLSAAAATANSAYEFSEALKEMSTCLLDKTALSDNEESGRVLLMLGKAQFELQKLVDSYRAHVIQTITTPSESLLKELQTVEEMKHQCDDKRNYYKVMLAEHKEKGKSRNSKAGSFSYQQLQAAREDYEEESTLFVFRLKSLKQGQCRSLLTQAARHHAAQLNFFRKGVQSLEVIEPHVKVISEQHHIDYQFSGLEDDDTADVNDVSYNVNDDGELSFDYIQSELAQDVDSASRSSMEEDLDGSQANFSSFNRGPMSSQSAPIFAEKKFEQSERLRQMQPTTARGSHTYVLPTPVDAKTSALAGSVNIVSAAPLENRGGWPTQLWHTSPLEPNFGKDLTDDEPLGPPRLPKAKSVKEINISSGPNKLPPPLAEGLLISQSNAADAKKIKRQAFAGPLANKAWSSKASFSATPVRGVASQPSVSPKVSPSASPPMLLSKTGELHELPRPPTGSEKAKTSSLVGHSEPLVPRGQQLGTRSRPSNASLRASPLPIPPGTYNRSFSVPSRDQRRVAVGGELVELPHKQNVTDNIYSSPSRPFLLTNTQRSSIATESVAQVTETENKLDVKKI